MNPKKIQSDIFRSFDFLNHGFLTRAFHDEQAKGVEAEAICRLKQVHSSRLVEVSEGDVEKYRKEEADAMLTKLPRIALTIVTADCIPLLFCDPKKRIIAAAHAGWRGTSNKVAQKTIQKMIEWGADPENIFVALGPSVQKCCYEVDRKVYDQIEQKNLFELVEGKEGHWRVSLQEVNRAQLMGAGVLKNHIEISPLCTSCLPDQFHSYRRDGERAGRQWSYVALRAAAPRA